MQARFFCKTGELAGSEFRIAGEATIGRGPRSTIVLKADAVSKAHARITFDATTAAYFLEDLDSTNGTRLDGVPVSQRQRLSDLHVVTLGKRHDFIFVVMPDDVGEPGSVPHEERAAPSAKPPPPATRYEPPPALDLPSFRAEPRQNEAKSSGAVPEEAAQHPGGMDGRAMSSAAPATRHEPAPVSDVPPLGVKPGPAEAKSGRFALDEATLIRGSISEPAAPPPESVTRHESAAAPDVPPSSAEPTPAEADRLRAGREANARLVAGQELAAPLREAATADESSATLDFPQLDARPSPPSGTVIEIRIADGGPRRMTLGDGRHVVGRAKDCAVRIDDTTLSRRHAAFVVLGDRVTVVDLDSRNGTFFDEAPVESATEVAVGRTVTFGNRVRVVRIEP